MYKYYVYVGHEIHMKVAIIYTHKYTNIHVHTCIYMYIQTHKLTVEPLYPAASAHTL